MSMSMSIGINNWFSRVLAALIAMFSTAGCCSAGKTESADKGRETKCVYGVPMAYYKVHGKVSDTSNQPIEGVMVNVEVSRRHDNGEPLESYDYEMIRGKSTGTNQKGEYLYNGEKRFNSSTAIKVIFTDPSGKFKTDSVFSRTPIINEVNKWKQYYEYEVNATLQPINEDIDD